MNGLPKNMHVLCAMPKWFIDPYTKYPYRRKKIRRYTSLFYVLRFRAFQNVKQKLFLCF